MNLDFEFKREGFSHYINRALGDELFTERKGPIIGKMIWVFASLFQRISSLTPISLIPIIDCNIYGEKSKADHSQTQCTREVPLLSKGIYASRTRTELPFSHVN